MTDRRRFLELAGAAALGSAFAVPAFGQTWPTRVPRIIVPFPAGVAPDVVARILAARLSDMWGQQVVIENKPGAGGNVGMEAAARSAPDGYTVLMAAFTPIAQGSARPTVRRDSCLQASISTATAVRIML